MVAGRHGKKYKKVVFIKKMSNENFKKIKLFLSDVDGVMTDAGMYYTESGDEFKKFNTHDGMGFNLLAKAGIKTGIITTENTKMVERRAAKLKIDYVYQGKGFGNKLEAAKDICALENVTLEQTAYIGDDINCIELLSAVGIAACPSNAISKVKAIPNIIHLKKSGGDGAVREFIDQLFDKGCFL
jgi:3-deoxy-D-manno-octulosonate 8-phosphate phosphatase (KDO 8-P phosphatase)